MYKLQLQMLACAGIFFVVCGVHVWAEDAGAETHHRRGTELFFAGKFADSVLEFDAEIKLEPERAPQHWQRGIALYYAGRYDNGRKQFEVHRTVNPNDVENAAWHFLCAAKASSLAQARAKLIPIDLAQDTRVPMKQIYALFKGDGSAAEVLAAAHAGEPSAAQLKNNLCYAHLYLALYYDALGETKLERTEIQQAAVDFKEEHYMGLVAQAHAKFKKIE